MPSTTRSRQRAAARNKSLSQIVAAARPTWRTIAHDLKAAIIKAYREGKPVPGAITEQQDRIQSGLLDVMVASNLKATLDITTQVASTGRRMSLLDNATKFLRKRLELDEDDIEDLRDLYTAEAIAISDDIADTLRKGVLESIAESTRLGEHVDDGVERLKIALDQLGMTEVKDYALEAVFRTQTQLSYAGAEWNNYQDPDLSEILWGYEYVTAGDDRVRDDHAALDGTRLPKDDPFWERYFPPNGWNCRCVAIPIYLDEVGDNIKSKPPEYVDGRMPQPDEGWDFNPGEVFREVMAASLVSRKRPSRIDSSLLDGTYGRDRVLLGLHLLGGSAKQCHISQVIRRDRAQVSRAINGLDEELLVVNDNKAQCCTITTAGKSRVATLLSRIIAIKDR